MPFGSCMVCLWTGSLPLVRTEQPSVHRLHGVMTPTESIPPYCKQACRASERRYRAARAPSRSSALILGRPKVFRPDQHLFYWGHGTAYPALCFDSRGTLTAFGFGSDTSDFARIQPPHHPMANPHRTRVQHPPSRHMYTTPAPAGVEAPSRSVPPMSENSHTNSSTTEVGLTSDQLFGTSTSYTK